MLTCDSTTFVALLTAFKPSNKPIGLPSSSLRGLTVSSEPENSMFCVRCVNMRPEHARTKVLLCRGPAAVNIPAAAQASKASKHARITMFARIVEMALIAVREAS